MSAKHIPGSQPKGYLILVAIITTNIKLGGGSWNQTDICTHLHGKLPFYCSE